MGDGTASVSRDCVDEAEEVLGLAFVVPLKLHHVVLLHEYLGEDYLLVQALSGGQLFS